MARDPQIPVRFNPEVVARIDALIPLIARKVEGLKVTRSDVFRLVVDRGLPILEAELKKTGGRHA